MAIEFTIIEHTSPCSYIRQFPHSAKNDEAVLRLAIKEYRPRNQAVGDGDAVTIVAAHGIGFPKEAYTSLWEDIVNAAKGFTVASIWIADVANHGASYDLNREELGDDPNWIDHSLDLLLMINRFRDRMTSSIIGIGHSMGCAQIAYLASVHPRLFQSVVFIEPLLQAFRPPGPNAPLFSSMRRDKWDSRAKAEAQIGKSAFFASMDPRSLKLYFAYALRDTPDGGVTLRTPKAQEAWTYAKQNFHPVSEKTLEGRKRERIINPDAVPFSEEGMAVVMRTELMLICDALPHIRPRVLYIYGETSHINIDTTREMHLSQTGIGRGGNGGVSEGGVDAEMLEGCGHLCCFEKPVVTAERISRWLDKEVAAKKDEKIFWNTVDTGKSKNGRTELSEKWLVAMKRDPSLQRSSSDKAKL
ncbi:hypothetical protein ACN47E_009097 [Coniothyrium glycines]